MAAPMLIARRQHPRVTRYCIENVVVAEPPFEPSAQLTRAVAVPARVFERILQVHDTSPLPSAIWATWSAAVVDTRPEGRVTRIEQAAPADVRAPIVAEPPICAGDGTLVKRTRSPAPVGPVIGVDAGPGGGLPDVVPVPQR